MLRRSLSTTTSAWTSSARRDLEDRPQGGALAADAVDLRVGERDPVEAVGGPDEEDRLDVVRRLGLDHDALGAVGRARVRVDEDGLEVREVLDQPGVRRAHHVADGRGVLEARDADHDVGAAEAGDLFPDGGRQGRRGHARHPTIPAARPRSRGRATRHAQRARRGRARRTVGPSAGPAIAQSGFSRPARYRLLAARWWRSPKPSVPQVTSVRIADGLHVGRDPHEVRGVEHAVEQPLALEQRDVVEGRARRATAGRSRRRRGVRRARGPRGPPARHRGCAPRSRGHARTGRP